MDHRIDCFANILDYLLRVVISEPIQPVGHERFGAFGPLEDEFLGFGNYLLYLVGTFDPCLLEHDCSSLQRSLGSP